MILSRKTSFVISLIESSDYTIDGISYAAIYNSSSGSLPSDKLISINPNFLIEEIKVIIKTKVLFLPNFILRLTLLNEQLNLNPTSYITVLNDVPSNQILSQKIIYTQKDLTDIIFNFKEPILPDANGNIYYLFEMLIPSSQVSGNIIGAELELFSFTNGKFKELVINDVPNIKTPVEKLKLLPGDELVKKIFNI